MTSHRPQRQRGAALIIALILLIAMTILGVTAARDTVLQEQMTGNKRQKQIAFESAELTLRGGEQWLWDQMNSGRPQANAAGSCTPCNVLESGALEPLTASTWTGSDVRSGPDLAALGNPLAVADRPEYYIEEQQAVPLSPAIGRGQARTLQYYRLNARATGEQERVESIVQSTFVLLF